MTATEPAASGADRLGALLRARYRKPVANAAPWAETLGTLLGHRSVRAYRPDPLHDGVVGLLVAAPQPAPTSSNLQPWSVIAVRDPDRKERLSVLAGDQAHVRQAPLFLVWLVDLHRLRRIGEALAAPTDGLDYLESFLLGAVDTSLAAQNATVAAESIGLGTVYCGGIRNRPAEVAAELGLPPHVFALFGLSVGHPDPARPAGVKPRLYQEMVVFDETYAHRHDASALASYDERLRSFQREQAMTERNWTEQATQRVKGPQALSGRDRLRDELGALGFALR